MHVYMYIIYAVYIYVCPCIIHAFAHTCTCTCTCILTDFTIKDRPERLDNSVCDPPNGRVAVRDALVDVSFSLSLLVLGMAIGNLGLWKTGMGCGCDDSTDG